MILSGKLLLILVLSWTTAKATVDWVRAPLDSHSPLGAQKGTVKTCCNGNPLSDATIADKQHSIGSDDSSPNSVEGCSFNDPTWRLQEQNWKCYDLPQTSLSTTTSPCNNPNTPNSPLCARCLNSSIQLQYSPQTGYRCMTPCQPSLTSCDFYQCLDANYNGCGATGYPLGFGYLYCSKYAQKAHDFSPKGQTWIDKTRLCLEDELVPESTNSSMTCDQLSKAAFSTHAKCYIDSGVCDLPAEDWDRIFEVVGFQPWVSHFLDTFTEAAETGTTCAAFLVWQVGKFGAKGLVREACEAAEVFGLTLHCAGS